MEKVSPMTGAKKFGDCCPTVSTKIARIWLDGYDGETAPGDGFLRPKEFHRQRFRTSHKGPRKTSPGDCGSSATGQSSLSSQHFHLLLCRTGSLTGTWQQKGFEYLGEKEQLLK